MMEVIVGKKYRHFKGNIIEIIGLAKHSETLEDMVVYKHDGEVWVRPYSMFFDKVDKEKYPDITQEYRFEMINND
ncbi:MAG: DUF1653 domain-containing protein [Firmicutes bacterium]|nr:DUF1653 domain-containing protein [Bacillota bacterium]